MKKITLLVALICLTLTGCFATEVVSGNGNIKTYDFEYENFDTVVLGNNFDVILEQSDDYYVEITCDSNIVDYLDVRVNSDTLYIRLDQFISYKNVAPIARVRLPTVEKISGSGASEISMINEFILDNNIEINLSGSSDFTGNFTARDFNASASGSSDFYSVINVDDLDIDLSGASSVTLEGKGHNLNLDISGASDADLVNIQLNNANVDLSGASDATININGSLNLEASGASSLEYKGDPTISSSELSGASEIIKIN